MGLVMHMSLIEQASIEKWPINLLLLTVPDEEVNSAGMRYAIPVLTELQKQHELTYTLFLNSEPTFRHDPKDNTHYIYSGTIGKVLAGALFYGKETHAGEPLSGMTSPFISSFLTREMEWNPIFRKPYSEKPLRCRLPCSKPICGCGTPLKLRTVLPLCTIFFF